MKKQDKISRGKTELTINEVEHVADLAKLKLTTEDLEKFRTQLSSILDLVRKLQEVETEGILPTNQVTNLENVFREDEVDENRILTQEEVLSNAKRIHKGYFVVKAIFE